MEIFVLLYALWPFILIISFCIIGWKIGSFIRRKLSGTDSNAATPENPATHSKPIPNCPFCNAICQHPTEGANTCHCNQTFYFHKGEVMPLKDMMTPFEIASVQTLAKIAKADGIVSKNEVDFLDKKLNTLDNPRKKKHASIVFNSSKTSSVGFEPSIQSLVFFVKQRPNYSENVGVLHHTLDSMFRMALVDPPISKSQEEIIKYSICTFNSYCPGTFNYENEFNKYY